MRVLSLLLLFDILYFSIAQITVPTSGQCQAVCLQQYATAKEFFLLSGDAYIDVDLTNNTDFSLCKLGCHSPSFNELPLPAFKRGQEAYAKILDSVAAVPLRDAPGSSSDFSSGVTSPHRVTSLTLLCADGHANGSVSARLTLDVAIGATIVNGAPTTEQNTSATVLRMAHYVEALMTEVRPDEDESSEDAVNSGDVVWKSWAYTTTIDALLDLPVSNKTRVIQFRASSFDEYGRVGQMASTRWFREKELTQSFTVPLAIHVASQEWKDELAAVEVTFLLSNERLVPSCSHVLSYHHSAGVDQRVEFKLDRSRGFVMEKLAFDKHYIARLFSNAQPPRGSKQQGAVDAPVTSERFHVQACNKLVDDPFLCAPPPVASVEWHWNGTDEGSHSVILSWDYGGFALSSGDNSGASHSSSHSNGGISYPRVVHFDVSVTPTSTPEQYQCQYLDSQRRVVTETHRSVILYVADDRCNYEVEITVVDSRNRRSTPRKADVVRYDAQRSMLLAAERWSTGWILLISTMSISIIAITLGVLACRVKEKRDFNSLKRSGSSKANSSVVVGKYDPPLANSKRVMIGRHQLYADHDDFQQVGVVSPNTLRREIYMKSPMIHTYAYRSPIPGMAENQTLRRQCVQEREASIYQQQPPTIPLPQPDRYTPISKHNVSISSAETLPVGTLSRRPFSLPPIGIASDEDGYHTLGVPKKKSKEGTMGRSIYSTPPIISVDPCRICPEDQLFPGVERYAFKRFAPSSIVTTETSYYTCCNVSDLLGQGVFRMKYYDKKGVYVSVCDISWSSDSGNSVADSPRSSSSTSSSRDGVLALMKELHVLSVMKTRTHPNIVTFRGVIVEEQQVIGLLFDPCYGGSLHMFLENSRAALEVGRRSGASSGYDGSMGSDESEEERAVDRLALHLHRYATQLASALSFLHSHGCRHRHVSSSVVYLEKQYADVIAQPCDQNARLGDFAWASCSSVSANEEQPLSMPSVLVPPEMLTGKPFDTAGDIWQFGLLLCEMVSLAQVSAATLHQMSSNGRVTDKQLNSFVRQLSTGIRRVDPFFNGLRQKVSKCLTTKPKDRLSAVELEREFGKLEEQYDCPSDYMTNLQESVLV